jgi:hypothetical protein
VGYFSSNFQCSRLPKKNRAGPPAYPYELKVTGLAFQKLEKFSKSLVAEEKSGRASGLPVRIKGHGLTFEKPSKSSVMFKFDVDVQCSRSMFNVRGRCSMFDVDVQCSRTNIFSRQQ